MLTNITKNLTEAIQGQTKSFEGDKKIQEFENSGHSIVAVGSGDVAHGLICLLEQSQCWV